MKFTVGIAIIENGFQIIETHVPMEVPEVLSVIHENESQGDIP